MPGGARRRGTVPGARAASAGADPAPRDSTEGSCASWPRSSTLAAPRRAVRCAAARRPSGEPTAAHAAEAPHAAQHVECAHRVEALGAARAAHRLLLELLGRAQRLVERGGDEVLEHLDVIGIDGVWVDLERLHAQVARDDDLDHAAAGGRLDGLGLELLLRLLLLGEHRLRLLEHLVEVGRLGHQVDSSSGGRTSASNSSTKRLTSSSSLSWGGAGPAARAASSRSSKASRNELPVTARMTRAIVSLLVGSSALRLKKPADSGQARVSSPSPTAAGRALWSAAASIGVSSLRLSITAGQSSASASWESSTPAEKLGSGAGASGSTTATAATAGAGSASVASSAETAAAASSARAPASS